MIANAQVEPEAAGKLRAVVTAYVDAWLRGDAEAVLAVFTEDAVLLPHDGLAPLLGREAARAFWFGRRRPAGGIDAMGFELTGFTEHADSVVAWGSHYLDYWQTDDENGSQISYAFSGTVLLVFVRRDTGWAISHFMWDDPPPRRSVRATP